MKTKLFYSIFVLFLGFASSLAYIPKDEYVSNSNLWLAYQISKEYQVLPWDALEIVEYAEVAANYHQIPKSLVLAVIEKESSFRVLASNGKALGLMQVHPNSGYTLPEYYSISNNIFTGTQILVDFLKRSNYNLSKGLAMYNCGANYQSKQCKDYSKDVLNKRKKYFI